MHLFTAEVLDTEADAAQLDCIKLVYLVIELSLRVFERSNDEPEPIDGLLLSIEVTVFDVKPIYKR